MARSPVLRVAEREIQVFRKLWRGALGFALVQPVLYLAAMGLGLGGIIDENRGEVEGLPYLAFVAPGLLAASAMMVGGSEGLWPLQGRLKWMGSYKAMVATPITPAAAFRGWLVWIGVRTTIAAGAFLLVAAVAGGVRSVWGVLAVPAAVLCAAAFAAPIGSFSATQENDLAYPLIMRLGVIPLFLFSGTFFPVEQLPDWAEPLVWLSPLWHGVELARAATTGRVGGEWLELVAHVVVLAAVVAAGTAVGSRTFTRRLAP
ncbi:ABC transporter permease [Iamia sp. SCSIO 61187]|uniref:ABC transporter permease n=1 Tax=Iamia sp. SCSIO 61187 TaxID=2722752 RepID=UPI001C62F993|nr:ABC transporter permease [Iamia sp. SCSIO 61187]QYG93952.1 ABC transporter permease [Iamia sp. SCSIO 61187]